MAKFIVQGGKPLKGEVLISGSKNAALPILCASMLTKEKVILKNVPNIADIHTMIKILRAFGAKIKFQNNEMEISARNLKSNGIPNDVIKKMRASILILGGLLPRLGELKIAFPEDACSEKDPYTRTLTRFKNLGVKLWTIKTGFTLNAKNFTAGK